MEAVEKCVGVGCDVLMSWALSSSELGTQVSKLEAVGSLLMAAVGMDDLQTTTCGLMALPHTVSPADSGCRSLVWGLSTYIA